MRKESQMTVASFRSAALLVAALLSGCDNWTGFGFNASGPEMPRIKEALALRAGMVVADVGAGKGQLTRALAGTVGPGGHVFSTEIDPDRVKALRAMLAEANVGNVTVVEAEENDPGPPEECEPRRTPTTGRRPHSHTTRLQTEHTRPSS